jgi:site-specific DNA-methyltransferase (adenine-specific)
MLDINNIYNCDCLTGLKQLDNNSVNLTVTSPPYDNLRTYGDITDWSFDIFKPIAEELYRVTKPGGIVVWIVGDATVNGGETGSSFKQALYFQEIGFKIHDTMIYHKNSSAFPARATSKRYTQIFEYMFVFVKGKIRDDIKLIADKRNKWAGWTNWGQHTAYDADGNLKKVSNIKPIPEFSLRTNIWKYNVSFNDKVVKHPAVFPEQLAEDCIVSWSVEGDTVLDPFMGSGTTAKMAMLNNRNYIGFEINEEYYNGILKRLDKFKDYNKNQIEEVIINDDDNTENNCVVNDKTSDKELEEKTKLFNSLVEQLNEYFNEQSLGILKTLTLSFKSESNDKRVQKIIEERKDA